jgi:hypothetical protein
MSSKKTTTTTITTGAIITATLAIAAAAVLMLSLSQQQAQAETNPTLLKGIANLNSGADRTEEAGESGVATQLRDIASGLEDSCGSYCSD